MGSNINVHDAAGNPIANARFIRFGDVTLDLAGDPASNIIEKLCPSTEDKRLAPELRDSMVDLPTAGGLIRHGVFTFVTAYAGVAGGLSLTDSNTWKDPAFLAGKANSADELKDRVMIIRGIRVDVLAPTDLDHDKLAQLSACTCLRVATDTTADPKQDMWIPLGGGIGTFATGEALATTATTVTKQGYQKSNHGFVRPYNSPSVYMRNDTLQLYINDAIASFTPTIHVKFDAIIMPWTNKGARPIYDGSCGGSGNPLATRRYFQRMLRSRA